jgi:hypothetical protein
MDHGEAVRINATEKYLLEELDPGTRDQFEEHLFDCRECAIDLRAAAAFVEHSKTVLGTPEQVPVHTPVAFSMRAGWFDWLRPAIAAPVLAGLLAVIAYQNFVAAPLERAGREEPRVMPSVSLIAANTRGGGAPTVEIAKGAPFLAFVDVPADNRFASYLAEFYDPVGGKQWSLPIASNAVKETLSVQIPPVRGGSGTYTLVVRGMTAAGETTEVGRYPFLVQTR